MRSNLLLLTVIGITLVSVSLWFSQTANKKGDTETSLGEVAVGGNFTLTDQSGKIVHEKDFRGRIMLVFFGFTNCPDICPVSVATLSKMMESLGDKADGVAPIFITVDPERDTPSVMKEYLANFDKRIVGLTGTSEQVKQAASAYKAYYSKSHGDEDHGHAGGSHDYGVDHSGYIYMMSKEGKYLAHFPYNVPEKDITDAVRKQL